ncbi:SRPBCC family protein [Salinigranum marinum]|uniref:SRPBCC family protein n=1 Tax=Salinigranum marinum TaxID=1515595 RepID=UPI002989BE29|nr:SRPBCC family protein [Salinigranum marinum]
MVSVSTIERVSVAPERVFAFLDTPANHERISPSIASVHDVEPLESGGHRAAYTYRMVGVTLGGEIEVVAHDPPRRLRFAITGGIDGEMDWRIDADPEGALVTCEATFEVPGGAFGSVVEPVVRAYNQRELDRTLANLQAVLEALDTRS